MMKFRSLSLFIILMLVAVQAGSAAIWTSNFDDGTTTGWSDSTIILLTTDESQTSPYSLELNSTNGIRYHDETVTTDDYTYSWWFYRSTANTSRGIEVKILDGASEVFRVTAQSGGKLQTFFGGWIDIAPYQQGEWVHVEVKPNFTSDTAEVLVDDVSYGSFNFAGLRTQATRFQIQDSTTSGVVDYFDTVSIGNETPSDVVVTVIGENISITGSGYITISDINTEVNDAALLNETASNEWYLNANITIDSLVTFFLNSTDCYELALNSTTTDDIHSIINNEGIFLINDTEIYSWNKTSNDYQTTIPSTGTRAYPRSYIILAKGKNATGNITYSRIHHLGAQYTTLGIDGSGDASRRGLAIDGAENCYIMYNDIYGDMYDGITLFNWASNNTIYGNNINDTYYDGIMAFERCLYNNISNNTFTDIGSSGIEMQHGGNYCTIANNTIESPNDLGIYLQAINKYNIIENNYINYSINHVGIRLYSGSNFNTVRNNTVENVKAYDAMWIHSSDYNTVENNTFQNNKRYGVKFEFENHHNVIRNNQILDNGDYGIHATRGSIKLATDNTTITGNTIDGHTIAAIQINSDNTSLTSITANHFKNSPYGIQLYDGAEISNVNSNIRTNITTDVFLNTSTIDCIGFDSFEFTNYTFAIMGFEVRSGVSGDSEFTILPDYDTVIATVNEYDISGNNYNLTLASATNENPTNISIKTSLSSGENVSITRNGTAYSSTLVNSTGWIDWQYSDAGDEYPLYIFVFSTIDDVETFTNPSFVIIIFVGSAGAVVAFRGKIKSWVNKRRGRR